MIELKKRKQNFIYPFALSFTFEKREYKGESYKGHYEICSNPLCTCQDVQFVVESIDENPSDKKQYIFFVDVFKKRIANRKDYALSAINRNFAQSFINELNEKQWTNFQSAFYSYKAHITKNCNIRELNPRFSVQEIEQEGLMAGYQDIFPYGEAISFIEGDIEYFFDDQYCINPNCSCRDVALVIVPIRNGKVLDGNESPAVMYDYKNKKWRPDRTSQVSSFSLDKIMSKLHESIPNISSILKERHQKLRLLYENYKRKNKISTRDISRKKVGRNDPCPCGSGKKYKMCCGR